jgi:hypothetical protein
LLNSVAFVADFNNVTIVVKDRVNPLPYDSFFSGSSSGNRDTIPEAADIITCYFADIDSKCHLTVRWFPLVCTTTAFTIKTFIVIVALHRHSHFCKRIFNSLGDMITVGARYPHIRELSEQISADSAYRPEKIRWVRALGRWDLGVAIFWWASALGVTLFGALLWDEESSWIPQVSDRFKRYGLGTVTIDLSRSPDIPFFPALVIIANSPQIWLSIGYLLWNTQVTRIWMEGEWRSYYQKAHIPRVSQNTNETGVRATRWLQLPYGVTAILMMLSTIMHWLVSQTLSVVEIEGKTGTSFYLNHSSFAILCIGMVASVLVLGMTIYYFIPVRTNMPLMAGSARVVFESCKRLPSRLPSEGIAWGDISTSTERLAGFGETVSPLIVGAKYPGLIADEMYLDEYNFMSNAEADTELLVRRV